MGLDNDWDTVWSEYRLLFVREGLTYQSAECMIRDCAAAASSTLDKAADDWKETVVRREERMR